MIFKAFFKGDYARYAWSMSIALVCAIAFEAWLLTEVNVFYGSFWDAINGTMVQQLGQYSCHSNGLMTAHSFGWQVY